MNPTLKMNPTVKEVTPQADYHLRVTFTNGEIGIYDCRPLLDFGVFRELRDVGYFRRVRRGKRYGGLAPRTGHLPRYCLSRFRQGHKGPKEKAIMGMLKKKIKVSEFQIPDFKSQISNLRSQIFNLQFS